MTAPASAIGPVQDALAAAISPAIKSLPGLSKVRVGIGDPPKGPEKVEAWIDSAVTDWTQEWVTSGPPADATMGESFTLSVFLLAVKAGDNYQRARDVVTSMMQAVSDVLREDPTLGNEAFECEFAGGLLGAGALDQFRFVAAQVSVRVRAYLA